MPSAWRRRAARGVEGRVAESPRCSFRGANRRRRPRGAGGALDFAVDAARVDSRSEGILFADDFAAAGNGGSGWLEGGELQERPAARSREHDPLESRPSLLLPPGAGGLHRIVRCGGERAAVVAIRLRTLTPDGVRPALMALSLAELPGDADPRRQLLDARRTRVDKSQASGSGRPEFRVTSPDTAAGWHWLQLYVPRHAERRALRLSIHEAQGVLIDRIELRFATPLEEVGQARESTEGPPWSGPVECDGTRQRALLLPGGGAFRFEVDVGERAPRLELADAMHPFARAASMQLFWSVDGERIAERELDATARGWSPATISLERWAGRRVTLEVTAGGGRDAIAAIGDPWLLGVDLPLRRGGEPLLGDAPSPSRPNVLLISIDTLRRDALGCYGNARARTPAIDSLAATGTCFERATAPASYTLPSHVSLFTGQHPIVHGVIDGSQPIQPGRSTLLAERFAAAGWLTGAFTSGVLVSPVFGFARGFGTYGTHDPSGVHKTLQEEPPALDPGGTRFAALDPALDWMERRADQPWFLFVHTYFVHNYVTSAEFALERGLAPRPRPPSASSSLTKWLRSVDSDPRVGRELQHAYAAVVDEVDVHFVRPLLDALERLEIAERTLVVLVSDHGEQMQEHGALLHGRAIWNELVEVPLLIRGPGVAAGRRLGATARLEDIAPTLAAWAGLPAEEDSGEVGGRDLLRLAGGDDPGDTRDELPRLLHLSHPDSLDRERNYRWDGLHLGPWTLLREHLDDGSWRDLLFDAVADPRQQHDLASSRPTEAAALARRLEHEIERAALEALALEQGTRTGTPPPIDDEALKIRLRELGYADK
ncbi:MAG: sulfatase-like hydrolase/transferase [Phycisphaerales bacterium]